MINQPIGSPLCTCTTLDLMCIVNNKVPKQTGKKSQEICFGLFQSYEFKLNLGLSYLANIGEVYDFPIEYTGGNIKGIQSLGV
jgi:hypothetical protein